MLRRLLVAVPVRVHHGSLPRATKSARRAPNKTSRSTWRRKPNLSLVPSLIIYSSWYG